MLLWLQIFLTSVADEYYSSHPLFFRMSGNPGKMVVESLGSQTGRQPLPVGLIVSTRYEAGSDWQPQPLTPARALLALMDNTVAARQRPEKTMPILKQAVTGAAVITSKRGEARTIAPLLLNYLGA